MSRARTYATGRQIRQPGGGPDVYRRRKGTPLFLSQSGGTGGASDRGGRLTQTRKFSRYSIPGEICREKKSSTAERVSAQGVTAKQLIALAYGVRDSQVSGGPRWLDQSRWSIEAKAADFPGTFNRQQLLDAMKAILSDRFRLQTHMEKKEIPVYSLVVAEGAQQLKRATESSPFMRTRYGTIEGKSVSMDLLARTLSSVLDRPVINETGIEGTYEVELRWTPDQALDRTSPPAVADHDDGFVPGSIFTEIKNQLGLRLKANRGPGDIIQIERIELPNEN